MILTLIDSKKAMEQVFSSEFFNRLDMIIFFSYLNTDVILHIANKFVQKLETQLIQKSVNCLKEKVKFYLAQTGYTEEMGMR